MDQEQEEYLESGTNRLEYVRDDIINQGQPDDMMFELLQILTEEVLVPEVGRYYTFIYQPKTSRIRYDEHPLIACVGIFRWGIRGINYHWGTFRNYSWEEVIGKFHVVYPLELNDARAIPYQKFETSR